jgi:ABC-type transport system involved in multi-copper enzyme maturation permease subunit
VNDALRYEWTRLRTIRSTWWLTGSAIVVALLVAVLLGWAGHYDFSRHGASQQDIEDFGAYLVTQFSATGQVPSLVGFLATMIGIFAWGHEYRHGMVRASLTALNSRGAFWVAKYLVVGAWVLLVTFAAMLLSGLVGVVFLSRWVTVFDHETLQVVGWQLLSNLLLAWLAMAFTSLTRSQAFALVAIFLWPLLVEPLVNVFFHLVPGLSNHQQVLRFLPFSAQRRMVDLLSEPTSTFGDPLSPLGGSVVFAAVTALLMAASYVLFARRDA